MMWWHQHTSCSNRVVQHNAGTFVALHVISEPRNCSFGHVFVARFTGQWTTLQLLSSFERASGNHIFSLSEQHADELEYEVRVELWWAAPEDYFERQWSIPMPGPAHGLGSDVVCSGRDVAGSPLSLRLPWKPTPSFLESKPKWPNDVPRPLLIATTALHLGPRSQPFQRHLEHDSQHYADHGGGGDCIGTAIEQSCK